MTIRRMEGETHLFWPPGSDMVYEDGDGTRIPPDATVAVPIARGQRASLDGSQIVAYDPALPFVGTANMDLDPSMPPGSIGNANFGPPETSSAT